MENPGLMENTVAKSPVIEIPTSGGSYVRKPDGRLDQVAATRQRPAIHERELEPSAPVATPTKES